MFKLRLTAKQCICCGICMDVCDVKAIDMRAYGRRPIEGEILAYLALRNANNPENNAAPRHSFPYLAHANLCDGCEACVRECPVCALELQRFETKVYTEGSSREPSASF
jgi:ferredoxin